MIKRNLALFVLFIPTVAAMLLVAGLIGAAETVPAGAGKDTAGLGYIGASLAVGLACIGSSYAVAKIGSAGIGAVTEKPELMGRTLVFLGLAEGIAIYGLIIAIIILNKI
ncbi:MAG: ATP synthase subunit C [Syntrophaceae bacterium]